MWGKGEWIGVDPFIFIFLLWLLLGATVVDGAGEGGQGFTFARPVLIMEPLPIPAWDLN